MEKSDERLKPWARLAYGAGELGPAMAGSTMIFFQMIFLTNVAGLHASLAGSVLLAGKLWDAFNDPLIGWLSDRTRSRLGRRLPWMILCSAPFALFFVLFFWVPGFVDKQSQGALFAYYVIIGLLYSTFYTGMALPHSALTPELSHDYDERSRITGFRMAFSLGGSVGGLIVALIVFQIMAAATDTVKYLILGVIIALIGLLSMVWCVGGIWRTAVASDQARRAVQTTHATLPIRRQLGIVFSNRPFLIVCGIYLFSWLAMQFTATILPYYVASWLALPSSAFPMIALAVQATALLLIPAWGWLTVKLGKKPIYFLGMAFWLVAQGGLLFLQPGQAAWIYVLAVTAGIGISVCYLIPNAMLPDVLELDELETGERREGVYYGFFVFLQKLALAGGTFIVGQALGLAGYISSSPGEAIPTQPESALTAIRLAIGPLPALAVIAGMILAAFYPINKKRHQEILAQLRARQTLA